MPLTSHSRVPISINNTTIPCALCGQSSHSYSSCRLFTGTTLCIYSEATASCILMQHAHWPSATMSEVYSYVQIVTGLRKGDFNLYFCRSSLPNSDEVQCVDRNVAPGAFLIALLSEDCRMRFLCPVAVEKQPTDPTTITTVEEHNVSTATTIHTQPAQPLMDPPRRHNPLQLSSPNNKDAMGSVTEKLTMALRTDTSSDLQRVHRTVNLRFLPVGGSDHQYRTLFDLFGVPVRVRMVQHLRGTTVKPTTEPFHVAFVEYADTDAALHCIQTLNNRHVTSGLILAASPARTPISGIHFSDAHHSCGGLLHCSFGLVEGRVFCAAVTDLIETLRIDAQHHHPSPFSNHNKEHHDVPADGYYQAARCFLNYQAQSSFLPQRDVSERHFDEALGHAERHMTTGSMKDFIHGAVWQVVLFAARSTKHDMERAANIAYAAVTRPPPPTTSSATDEDPRTMVGDFLVMSAVLEQCGCHLPAALCIHRASALLAACPWTLKKKWRDAVGRGGVLHEMEQLSGDPSLSYSVILGTFTDLFFFTDYRYSFS